MPDYERFDKRVTAVEKAVMDLKEGQAVIKAALNNGIKSNLIEINKKMTDDKIEYMDDRRTDREILIRLNTIVEEHLNKHSGVLGNLKWIITSIIAITAVTLTVIL